jgi:integrase
VAKAGNTFAAVANAWFDKMANGDATKKIKPSWLPEGARLRRSQLDRLLIAELGRTPIADIDAPRLLAVFDKIDTTCMQKAARSMASAIFRHAIARGQCKYDIAASVRDALDKHEGANFKHIGSDELPAFLAALDAYSGARRNLLFTNLLMLTFTRTDELRLARWDEVDYDNALLTIRGRVKRTRRDKHGERREHLVPLCSQAIAILRELEQHRSVRNPYIFAGARALTINANIALRTLSAIGYEGRQTGHGFRHLASTVLNEQHRPDGSRLFDADAIERQLSHLDGTVRGTYNKAEYLPARRAMMQAYADLLDEYRTRHDGRNVVALPAKRERRRAA